MTTKTFTSIIPGRYRHYKGNYYQVLATARHSESEELLVVYRCLYGDNSLWVRPVEMFMENVLVEGCMVPRFSLVEAATTGETKEGSNHHALL